MAVNLSIKSVPDALAEALRRRAERNHRSLQGELMSLLEQALAEDRQALPAASAQPAPAMAALGVAVQPPTLRGASKPLEQWLAERRQGLPDAATRAAMAALPRSVDIVRDSRDARDGTAWRHADPR